MSDLAVSAVELTRRYGDVAALDCARIQVARREICAFLGLNGAGKTTTIRAAARDDAPDLRPCPAFRRARGAGAGYGPKPQADALGLRLIDHSSSGGVAMVVATTMNTAAA